MTAKKKQTAKQVKAKAPRKTVSAVVVSDKVVKATKKMGRPTTFTQPLADAFLAQLASGKLQVDICKQAEMPSITAVRNWRERNKDFEAAFIRARETGYDAIAADAMRIIDEAPRMVEGKFGDYVDSGHVTYQRNRADLRLRLLASMDPGRYGNKVSVDGAVQHNHAFPASFSAAMNAQEDSANVSGAQTQTH